MQARNVLSSNLRTGSRATSRTVGSDGVVEQQKRKGHLWVSLSFLEAPPGIGPGIEVLQTFALPLGHGALFVFNKRIISQRLTLVKGFLNTFYLYLVGLSVSPKR